MKKSIATLLTICSFYICSFAQTQKRFQTTAEIEIGASLHDSQRAYFNELKKWGKPSGHFAAQIIRGYNCTPNLAIGLGIGVKKYTSPVPRTLIPIIADFRIRPTLANNNPLHLGYQFSYNLVYNLARETTSTLSIGYQVRVHHFTLVPSIGYNYLWYKDAPQFVFLNGRPVNSLFSQEYEKLQAWSRHSLLMRVGVIF